MIENQFVFFIGLAFLRCSKKEGNSEIKMKEFIISTDERQYSKNHEYKVMATDYGTNNFIIDKDTNIYYYQKRKFTPFCSLGITYDTLPELINLSPEDLVELPIKNIREFIKLNLKSNERNYIYINSQLDTLSSKKINTLRVALNDYTDYRDNDRIFIRKTTQEEDTVLKYKKANRDFYPEYIKWDKTKLTNSKLIIKFVKPRTNQ